jgi:YgiT-type zinc finger domain-containing protein
MKKTTAPFHIDRKGIHLSLDDVPAWVCRQCGEPYFEECEVDSIQAIILAVDQETEKLAKTG